MESLKSCIVLSSTAQLSSMHASLDQIRSDFALQYKTQIQLWHGRRNLRMKF